ncbi:MAG: hypothetical protein AMJ92_04065 [candidate division Zixibacteria bacterium SM23_81]|nr:MAG: hypothetical protein AMJ92_04065 [candidate division Zixibacteria bacterium SM23_81]
MRAGAFVVVLSVSLLSAAALAGEVATQSDQAELSRTQTESQASRTISSNPSGIYFTQETASKGLKAEVPGLINYQGTLTDGDGVTLDTTVSMTFSIYPLSVGGTAVWTETQPAVVVSSGVFNVLLGSVDSIADTVFKDPERWLGVQVGGDPELTPRQRIAAVGYALWAAEADTAEYARSCDGGGGGGGWVDDGNVVRLETVTDSVGIGTTSPSAKLDIQGTLNVGVDDTGYDVNFYGYRAGDRFFWNKDQAALRAGRDSDGTHWDPDSVGYLSVALGDDTKASGGSGATAMGQDTEASGSHGATAMGQLTTASGSHGATAMGYGTTASGDEGATAMGNVTTASGDYGATALGDNTSARGDYGAVAMGYHAVASGNLGCTAIGRLVKAGPAAVTMVLGSGASTDTLINNISGSLMIGFDSDIPTLFVGPSSGVGTTGNVGIGTTSPNEKLQVDGTIKISTTSGHLLLHDTNGGGNWPGIRFTGNSNFLICGDDGSDENFGVYSQFSDNRTYDAKFRVHGKATGNWGKYIELTHDGTDGFIKTDAGGDLVLDPNGNVGIRTVSPVTDLHIVGSDTLGSVMIAPNSNVEDVAELVLAEDNDGTYSMNLKYDGSVNQLQLFGKSGATLYGPHVVVKRDDGKVGIGTANPAADLHVDGDLLVTGAYRGTIGPNAGAPFPRPAYDSGWRAISQDGVLILTHNLGGNVDNYVVDLQFRSDGINAIHHVSYGFREQYDYNYGATYYGLTTESVRVHRMADDPYIDDIRLRIWYYN